MQTEISLLPFEALRVSPEIETMLAVKYSGRLVLSLKVTSIKQSGSGDTNKVTSWAWLIISAGASSMLDVSSITFASSTCSAGVKDDENRAKHATAKKVLINSIIQSLVNLTMRPDEPDPELDGTTLRVDSYNERSVPTVPLK